MKHIQTFNTFNEAKAKPGPDTYHRGLSDDEIEDKEDQIKKQAKMDDDDPEAYKEMPGDKEAREKGEVKKSKHTKSYDKLYGEDTDEALSDYEDDEADYDELYKEYPYKDKKKRRRNESVVSENIRVGKVVAIKKYNPIKNRYERMDVTITDYIKRPGSKDFVEYDLKGKKRKVAFKLFKSMMESLNEETENGHLLRMIAGVGGDQADEFLSTNNVSLYKIRMALNTNKFTKYDLRDVITGKAPKSIEKKVMKHITESITNEACWKGYKQVGMKDKNGKKVPNCVPESKINEKAEGDRSKLDAQAEKGLKNKSDETGVPIALLRIVYRRGMAAWKSGHRPGAGQQQWAYARVNSFLTKQPGTWGGADKDVAKEVRDGGHDKKLKKA